MTSTTLAPAARDHFVHFYETDPELVGQVARYLRNAIDSGCGALMIATLAHREATLAAWRDAGFDPARALARRQLVLLDARECLDQFMRFERPDPIEFDRVVGKLVSDCLERCGDVVAFGEMVALLWAEGRHEAATELEDLWNRLAMKQRFALYCAYPAALCEKSEATEAFRLACRQHSHVVPTRPVFGERSEAEQLRLLAEVSQKSAALENEVRLRSQVEARLRQGEADLADFLENGVVGMHRVAPDGTILWANRAELAMLGYERDDYVGHKIAEFYVDRGLAQRILATLFSGGVLKEQSVRMICKDGSHRHVLVDSSAQMDGGKFVATRCFTRDVTDRWLAQEALRERSAILHLALLGARMGYWVGDLDQDRIRYSPELAAMLGSDVALEGSVGSFLDLLHPEDRARFAEAIATPDSRRLAIDFRARTEGDDWRWFEARWERLFGSEGEPTRIYGICTDITTRKQQEHMLKHLAAVVESASDAIVTKTLDSVVTSWNPAAERLFGYRAEEIIGKSILAIIPPDLRDEEAHIIAKMRAGERVEHFETARLAKDGSNRRVSITVSPVRDAAGAIIGASAIAREVR